MSAADQPAAPSRACPFCGHELRGLDSPTVTCPECGRFFDAVGLDLHRSTRLRLALTLLTWGLPLVPLSILVQTAATNGVNAIFSHPWWVLLPAAVASLLGTALLASIAPPAVSFDKARLITRLCAAAIILACVRAGLAVRVGSDNAPGLEYLIRTPNTYRSLLEDIQSVARALWDMSLLALTFSAPSALAETASRLGMGVTARWLRRIPLVAVAFFVLWLLCNAEYYVAKPFLVATPPRGPSMPVPLTKQSPAWYDSTFEAFRVAEAAIAFAVLVAVWVFSLLAKAHVATFTPPRPFPASTSRPSAAAAGTPPARP